MTTKIQFGYWDFRGRGQVVRHLLSYSGLEWEETVYTDAAKWFASDKQTLGMDFPNLPYLIDGEFTLSESVAMARYVANRSGKTELLGKNFHDSAKIDEIFGVFEDLRTQFFKLYADKGYKQKLKEIWQKIQPKLQFFDKFVGQKKWFLGYLTLADFQVAQWSAWIDKLYPQECKAYPSLQRIRDNFNKLQKVKEYYTRPNAVHGPYAHPAYSAIEF